MTTGLTFHDVLLSEVADGNESRGGGRRGRDGRRGGLYLLSDPHLGQLVGVGASAGGGRVQPVHHGRRRLLRGMSLGPQISRGLRILCALVY